MKIYIRAAEERSLEFVVDLCFAFNDNIEAAFNPDLTDSELDEIIEETAEEYYVSFMKTVAFNLRSMDLRYWKILHSATKKEVGHVTSFYVKKMTITNSQ